MRRRRGGRTCWLSRVARLARARPPTGGIGRMSQWARENGWTKRTTYTLRAVGVHRRVPILSHGNNLRDCLRVGIAGWVELRADVEGSDAIEGGRVILSAGRQSGKARDGSDSSSKQNTPQHFRRPTIDRYQETPTEKARQLSTADCEPRRFAEGVIQRTTVNVRNNDATCFL